MKLYRILLFVIIACFSAFAQYTPIKNLHDNDANGAPKDTNTLFVVKGVVTASNQLGNGTSGPGSIQDATAGISVYGTAFATTANLKIGDTVIVTSRLAQYNGLSQLDFRKSTSSSVVKVASGIPAEPVVTTIPAIKAQTWNGYEEFESRLVRLNAVKFTDTTTFAPGTSGKTYTITDTLGNTFDFRICVNGTGISGTPIPRGRCDVIGIVSQFKSSTPYNSGYQIIPRNIYDIIADGSPVVNSNSVIINGIDTASFNVYYETVRNGNTQVKYGLTPELELDSVVIANDTMYHTLKISGLQKGTKYYFRPYSRNSVGSSMGPLQLVTTATGGTTTGTINVYFNMPVDNTVAIPGNEAKGSVDLTQPLINRINNAQYSIDMAVYSFNGLDNLTNALLAAKNRGVKIRLVYDSRSGSTTQASVSQLLNAGIKMSQRPASLDGIMHNKFFVFDARDGVAANDWVWSGSWNPTTTEITWKNNALEINDPALAAAYTTEFEEMWGSNTDTPNSATAKFAGQKTDNTPHSFSIGGRPVQLYFSPSDQTTNHIISTINTADKSIYFAVMAFTKNEIGTAIKNRYNAGVPGTEIRGIIDDVNGVGSEFSFLKGFADMWANPSPTLHSKYLIVDASYPSSQPTVLTGSHNWSAAAETSNDENTLIIQDLKIANQYMQDFKKRYNDAGGQASFIIPNSVMGDNKVKDYSFTLYQNYPNPFNPVTTISFNIPTAQHVKVRVYNALGELMGTIFDKDCVAGKYVVDFSSRISGKEIPSGIYFYQVTAGSYSQTRKMVLSK
ncbi:MAG: phospholipase D-like domain-containing protein [Ignavibacteria bacterium]|nr:phospholipase D-like domain-containing protein [Ignavibacteria bacterium]